MGGKVVDEKKDFTCDVDDRESVGGAGNEVVGGGGGGLTSKDARKLDDGLAFLLNR